MAQVVQGMRPPRTRSVPPLPEEIWDMITGYTSYKAQKQLRLCSRTLSRIAATYLYRTIYLEIQKDSIERMINIAFHDVLRYHVKELVLLECSQLVPFVSWREWYTHIENIADCKLNRKLRIFYQIQNLSISRRRHARATATQIGENRGRTASNV